MKINPPRVTIDLPTHPDPMDYAEVRVDEDEFAALGRKVLEASPSDDTKTALALMPTLIPLLRFMFAMGMVAERTRVAEWFQKMAKEEVGRGHNVRAMAFAQLGMQLVESLAGIRERINK